MAQHSYASAYASAYTIDTAALAATGWVGLLGILRADREERLQDEMTPPVACPIHGEPLQQARGVLHCSAGHIVDPDVNRGASWL